MTQTLENLFAYQQAAHCYAHYTPEQAPHYLVPALLTEAVEWVAAHNLLLSETWDEAADLLWCAVEICTFVGIRVQAPSLIRSSYTRHDYTELMLAATSRIGAVWSRQVQQNGHITPEMLVHDLALLLQILADWVNFYTPGKTLLDLAAHSLETLEARYPGMDTARDISYLANASIVIVEESLPR